MRRIEPMAACPSRDVTMWNLLYHVAREVWTVLRFFAFLADGLFEGLRLALLGYVLFLTLRSAVPPPG